MSYVAVIGGRKAIDEAEKLLRYMPWKEGSRPIEIGQIRSQMRLAVDRAMSEGSLYDPDMAALALKQAEGDLLEAAFLLRAFRSTLPRNYDTLPIDTSEMDVIRRISATFKEVPGGQYLGPTRDYTKRLLQLERLEESEQHVRAFVDAYLREGGADCQAASGGGGLRQEAGNAGAGDGGTAESRAFPRVIELLRREGLLDVDGRPALGEAEPAGRTGGEAVDDITRDAITFPASRAARLQTMARGETGALMAFAYSSVRGYGDVHPTIGELRVGYVPVRIAHPLHAGETITIGRVLVTEAEIVVRVHADGEGERTAQGEKPKAKFSIGYGLCFGHNEDKAISMGILDRTMKPNPSAPAEDEEFVLYHIDGIESSGFISHFKLPHYVDFQAELQRIRSINRREDEHVERL